MAKADLAMIRAARKAAAIVHCTWTEAGPVAQARGVAICALNDLARAAGSEPFLEEFDRYDRSWRNGKGWPDPVTAPEPVGGDDGENG